MRYSRLRSVLSCAGAAASVLILFLWVSQTPNLQHPARQSLQDHVRLAEKIWAKTVIQRHGMLRDWEDPSNMPFHPDRYQHPYCIWDFVPPSYSCPYEVERIGKMGDGGKWVCGMSVYENLPADTPCVMYSFGVKDDSSFEEEMLARVNCEVWAYDFSVDELGPEITEKHRGRIHFMKAGISGETQSTQNPPFYTIADLMKMNGHDYIDILKIDIESAEYDSLTQLAHDFPGPSPIGQMLLEIHIFGGNNFTSGQFLKWWELLENRGLRPTWTEPNLAAPGLCSEYTFINAKHPRNLLFQAIHTFE